MKKILSILLLFLTVSCSNISSNEQVYKMIELNKSEAIDLHDELMAKMGELQSLKKQLAEVISDSTEIENGNIKLTIALIDEADKSMWDWMHGFDVTYKADEDSITLQYYESKLKSIQESKVLFDSAIYRSNQLLE